MRRLKRLAVWAMLLAVAMFGVATWMASSELITPRRKVVEDWHREIMNHPREHGMTVEAFTVGRTPCLMCTPVNDPGTAEKGRKLRAEVEAAGVNLGPWGDIKGTIVLLHGHNGCKEDNLPIAERFCAAGFRCVLLDLPGHGQNTEPYARFGVTESSLPGEVLSAAAQQYGFKPEPASLFGISQGGAIALQAAARDGEKWFAVAEICSFADLADVLHRRGEKWFGALHPMAGVAFGAWVRLRAGYDPFRVRPVEAAARLTMPMFVCHGVEDGFVTPDHAKRLFDAAKNPDKELMLVPGAAHGNVLSTPAPVYARVSAFLLRAVEKLGK